jgi:signal transduction histidine kinase
MLMVKFTEEGRIEGGCVMDEKHHLAFYVSDTGIGIPPDKYNFIFERFAQLQDDSSHLHGVTGLGLSIVKGLVGLLGGIIWLESELGKGTVFYFNIPVYKIRQSINIQ